MGHAMRKPDFCLCENKGADQLCSNCTADQRLCFRYMDSTISLLHESEISYFKPSCVDAQAGLCQTCSETPKTGFLTPGSFIHFVSATRKEEVAGIRAKFPTKVPVS